MADVPVAPAPGGLDAGALVVVALAVELVVLLVWEVEPPPPPQPATTAATTATTGAPQNRSIVLNSTSPPRRPAYLRQASPTRRSNSGSYQRPPPAVNADRTRRDQPSPVPTSLDAARQPRPPPPYRHCTSVGRSRPGESFRGEGIAGFNGPLPTTGGFVEAFWQFVGGFFANQSRIPVSEVSLQAICAAVPGGSVGPAAYYPAASSRYRIQLLQSEAITASDGPRWITITTTDR